MHSVGTNSWTFMTFKKVVYINIAVFCDVHAGLERKRQCCATPKIIDPSNKRFRYGGLGRNPQQNCSYTVALKSAIVFLLLASENS